MTHTQTKLLKFVRFMPPLEYSESCSDRSMLCRLFICSLSSGYNAFSNGKVHFLNIPSKGKHCEVCTSLINTVSRPAMVSAIWKKWYPPIPIQRSHSHGASLPCFLLNQNKVVCDVDVNTLCFSAILLTIYSLHSHEN